MKAPNFVFPFYFSRRNPNGKMEGARRAKDTQSKGTTTIYIYNAFGKEKLNVYICITKELFRTFGYTEIHWEKFSQHFPHSYNLRNNSGWFIFFCTISKNRYTFQIYSFIHILFGRKKLSVPNLTFFRVGDYYCLFAFKCLSTESFFSYKLFPWHVNIFQNK